MKKKVSKKFSKEVISFDKKKFYSSILIICFFILSFVIYLFFFREGPFENSDSGEIGSPAFFECISKVSKLYVQEWCSHCTNQKKILGEGLKLIETIDCGVEEDKCLDITATPTWIINDKKVLGVQSLENLAKLTGC